MSYATVQKILQMIQDPTILTTPSTEPHVEKINEMATDNKILTVWKPAKENSMIGKIILTNNLNTNKSLCQNGTHNSDQ